MSDWEKVPCSKCKKPMLMNASGICKDCIKRPCYWCGTICRSKEDKPSCTKCHKRSRETRETLRTQRLQESENA